jgi:cytochrome P450
VARRHRMAWLPFGAGEHICIGAQLATLELTVAVLSLLESSTVIVPDDAADVPPVVSGLVLRPSAPMPYRLVPRR